MKDIWKEIKCFGSTTVGPRGQVVIPASARKEMAIENGTTYLVFKAIGGRGVLLLETSAVTDMLSMANQHLMGLAKIMSNLPSRMDGEE